jgi:protein-tyrosine phosphatase
MDEAIESGGVVLVHCHAGISRSSSTVISYLMRKYDLTLKDAIEHTRSQRWFINPNPGFMKQLK